MIPWWIGVELAVVGIFIGIGLVRYFDARRLLDLDQ